MQGFSSRFALGESNNKRSLDIAKWDCGYNNNVARSERFRHIIAERITEIRGLDERIWGWKGLTMIYLMNVLHILIDGQAPDVVDGQSKLERAIRGTVHRNVELLIANENINLEGVP